MGKTRTFECKSCKVSFTRPPAGKRTLCPGCFSTMAQCTSCKTIKPLSDFSKNSHSTNGHQSACKKCKSGCTCKKCGVLYWRTSQSGAKKLCPSCAASFSYCYSCKNHKEHDEFSKSTLTNSGFDGRCKACSRALHLFREYGIDPERYDYMFAEQAGLCAICLRPPPDNRPVLFVDHCHRTGTVRGLLCNFCNTSIGYLRDDVPTILRAADYVFTRSPALDESEIPIPKLKE